MNLELSPANVEKEKALRKKLVEMMEKRKLANQINESTITPRISSTAHLENSVEQNEVAEQVVPQLKQKFASQFENLEKHGPTLEDVAKIQAMIKKRKLRRSTTSNVTEMMPADSQLSSNKENCASTSFAQKRLGTSSFSDSIKRTKNGIDQQDAQLLFQSPTLSVRNSM